MKYLIYKKDIPLKVKEVILDMVYKFKFLFCFKYNIIKYSHHFII